MFVGSSGGSTSSMTVLATSISRAWISAFKHACVSGLQMLLLDLTQAMGPDVGSPSAAVVCTSMVGLVRSMESCAKRSSINFGVPRTAMATVVAEAAPQSSPHLPSGAT